jgi:hypothetical protein
MEKENIKSNDVDFRDKLKELQRQAIKQVREDRKQRKFSRFYKVVVPVLIILPVAFYFVGKTMLSHQSTKFPDQLKIKEYRFPIPPDHPESGGTYGKTGNIGNIGSSNNSMFDLDEETLLESENEALLNSAFSGNDSSTKNKDSAADHDIEWLETEETEELLALYGTRITQNLVCSGVKSRDCVVPKDNFTLNQGQNPHVWMEVFSDIVPYVLKHVYYHEGRKYVEVPLTIEYPRMRTWSYITLKDSDQVGFWQVETVAEDGSILGRVNFNVISARQEER